MTHQWLKHEELTPNFVFCSYYLDERPAWVKMVLEYDEGIERDMTSITPRCKH